MEILDHAQVLARLAKAIGKPCMYISINSIHDAVKAAPYLQDHTQVIMDGSGIVICESEDEMEELFNQTIGDDGPTMSNRYDGPARVYALTCSANGELGTENT